MLLQNGAPRSGGEVLSQPDVAVYGEEGEDSGYYRFKVVLDFVGAAFLLLLASPLIFLGALLIKLTSRGPAIYTQTRLGYRGRPYTIYKLRSMTIIANSEPARAGRRRTTRASPGWAISCAKRTSMSCRNSGTCSREI